MHSKTMGVKSVLRSIPSKYLILKLFERFAPSVRIDWSQGKRKFDAALSAATDELSTTSPAEWKQLVGHLEDIAAVCADRKSPERFASALKGHPKIDSFLLFTEENRCVQNGACWLLLNAPEYWQRIAVAAKARSISTRNTQVFLTSATVRPDNTKVDDFARAISELLFAELRHGNHAHAEFVDDGEACRYFLSVNRYPNNVQHFDDAGEYAVRDDKTAENFTVEYVNGCLTVRCDYGVSIRRKIADCFARIILHGRAFEQGRSEVNLTRHLTGSSLPCPKDERITSVRRTGLSVSYVSDGGEQHITLSTTSANDQREMMHSVLEHFNVPPRSVRVDAVFFVLTVTKHDGTAREVTARIASTGVCVNCRDRECCTVVRRYLTEVAA